MFLPKDSSKNNVTKIEKINIGRRFAKVAHTQFEQTAGNRRPPIPLTELNTQHAARVSSCKFHNCSVERSFLFSLEQKV